MKTTVIHAPLATPKEFPKLMIDATDSEVVLFYKEEEGIVVHPGTCSSSYIGKFRIDTNMTRYEEYKGEVILSNEESK